MKSSAHVLMLVENNSYPKDPRVRQEAEALAAAGCRVSVISPAQRQQALRETIGTISVYRYPAPPPANGLLSYLYEYAYSMTAIFLITLWLFVREGFDVIHAANPPDTFVFIAVLYKLLGKRFIYDHHDLAPEMYYARFAGRGNKFVYHLLIWCEKLSCQLADQVIATNQSYKAIEMRRHHIPEELVTIVRNGPDLSTMQLRKAEPTLRQKASTIIAYAGVMGVQDGVDLLLYCVHHLVYDLGRRDLLCILIGDGDAMPALRELVRRFALGEHVLFTGWIDHSSSSYTRYLSTADICVDPSPSTAYNDCSTTIKLMEYMALAKPIVAFDLPEHRFTAQSAALYACPNDTRDLARAIEQLLEDAPRRQMMGSFGRRRVEAELSWSHSVPKLLQVYRKLLPNLG